MCKLTSVEGIPTVKLSDNPRKTSGPAEMVERYRRVFGTVAVGATEGFGVGRLDPKSVEMVEKVLDSGGLIDRMAVYF